MSLVSFRLFAACLAAATLGPGAHAAPLGPGAHAAPLGPGAHAAPPASVVLAAGDAIGVHEAWARASAGAATAGAVYVTLMGGDQPDSLVGASTPVAVTAEAHETINDGGVMKMRPAFAVPIPAHQTVTFSPGGYHIMLLGLKHPLVAGQSFPLTLRFAHAAPETVEVKVQAVGNAAPTMGHDGMKM